MSVKATNIKTKCLGLSWLEKEQGEVRLLSLVVWLRFLFHSAKTVSCKRHLGSHKASRGCSPPSSHLQSSKVLVQVV
jgi:hypothetical protein